MAMEISNNGVISQIMDLKTSTPGVTRKEEIKTGYKNVNDYSHYLQGKYGYMNTGQTSMQGVPINVTVSTAFLQRCKDDPEKAAYLEENLAAIPKCIERAVNYTKGMPGSPTMTYCNVSFDENGNITMTSGCTNDPDGKIARENAKRKAEEEKAIKERNEKKRADKKAEEERLDKQLVEKGINMGEYSVSVVGTTIKSVTEHLLNNISSGNISGMVGFDARA